MLSFSSTVWCVVLCFYPFQIPLVVSVHLLLCLLPFCLSSFLLWGRRITELSESLFLWAFSYSALRLRWNFFPIYFVFFPSFPCSLWHLLTPWILLSSIISSPFSPYFIFPKMSVYFVSCFCLKPALCAVAKDFWLSYHLLLSLNSPFLPLCNSVVWWLLVLVMGTAAMGIYCMGLVWFFCHHKNTCPLQPPTFVTFLMPIHV